jgi:hypothetical protein
MLCHKCSNSIINPQDFISSLSRTSLRFRRYGLLNNMSIDYNTWLERKFPRMLQSLKYTKHLLDTNYDQWNSKTQLTLNVGFKFFIVYVRPMYLLSALKKSLLYNQNSISIKINTFLFPLQLQYLSIHNRGHINKSMYQYYRLRTARAAFLWLMLSMKLSLSSRLLCPHLVVAKHHIRVFPTLWYCLFII